MYHSGLIIATSVTSIARHDDDGGGDGADCDCDCFSVVALATATALAATLEVIALSCCSMVATTSFVAKVDKLAVIVGTVVNGGTGTVAGNEVIVVASADKGTISIALLALDAPALLCIVVSDAMGFFFASAWRRTMER